MAPGAVLTTLEHFRDEFEAHVSPRVPGRRMRNDAPHSLLPDGKQCRTEVRIDYEHNRIRSSSGHRRRPHGGGPARHDDPQRRARHGRDDPHVVQLSRAVALRRLPRVPGRDRDAARRPVGGLVQPPDRRTVDRPHRNRAREGVAPHGAGTALGPGPRFARTGRVRRRAGRQDDAVSGPPARSAFSAGCARGCATR